MGVLSCRAWRRLVVEVDTPNWYEVKLSRMVCKFSKLDLGRRSWSGASTGLLFALLSPYCSKNRPMNAATWPRVKGLPPQ